MSDMGYLIVLTIAAVLFLSMASLRWPVVAHILMTTFAYADNVDLNKAKDLILREAHER